MLEGEDVLSTANAMQALGATVERTGERRLAGPGVGVGGFAEPRGGARFRQFRHRAAGWPWAPSPAARSPRRSMAMPACARGRCGASSIRWSRWARARSSMREGGRLPLTLQGARDPMPIDYETPVPSAQLKSAVLLAGLDAPGAHHRDRARGDARPHREDARAFRRQRAGRSRTATHGRRITLEGQPELGAAPVVVPADPSSAAFPLVARADHRRAPRSSSTA